MCGDAEWLIEAIREKRLIVFRDEWNNRRTLEPQTYATVSGNREMLFGYQIDAGHGVEPEQLWKMLPISTKLAVDKTRRFAHARQLPPHLQEHVRTIHASAQD